MLCGRASSARRSILPLAALLLASGAGGEILSGEVGVGQADPPPYDARDPSAAEVTEENLLERPGFWPYRVKLARDWQPPGDVRPLAAGRVGVLIRVEAGRRARVDFGRYGCHEVPVAATDLVQSANQVRTGALAKVAPNLLFMIGGKLVDPGAERAVPLDYAALAPTRALVAVFADPTVESFDKLAAALRALPEREGALAMLVPQGGHSTGEVTQRLRSLEWNSPFVFPHISEALTQSLLAERPPPPPARLVLLSGEGRLHFDAPWSDADGEVVAELRAALDRALAATDPAAKPASP
jgi:hypothetical protein